MDQSNVDAKKKQADPAAAAELQNKPSPEYDVGYGKPPKHSQFKPGQSGNPKGRPKGSKNLKSIIAEEANTVIEIKEGGKTKKVTKTEALVKSVIAKGIKGDNKSASTALGLIGEVDVAMQEASDAKESYSKEDLEVLKSYASLQQMLKGALDD